ncbi:hypothetical protein CR51_00105 [Caballeronia megalochromosomata]|jgi:chitin disaccharide deacetylase|nr:hypothetical protein CR51_00105 [Caballeronia megalochromosomata]
MREIIFNADDFGLDADTFDATVKCFETGILRSATIMTGMPMSSAAYGFARSSREFSFGLHFNIVDSHLPLSQCASLCDSENRFRESHRQRRQALAHRVNAADVAREFDLQITELLDNGVQVSHVDSHGHLHKFPAIINAIKPSLKRFGIRRVRRPQNLFFRRTFPRQVINGWFAHAFDDLNHPDNFLAIDTAIADWPDKLHSLLPDGLTEISVHPGTKERWRLSEGRPFFAGREIADVLKKCDVRVTSYLF